MNHNCIYEIIANYHNITIDEVKESLIFAIVDESIIHVMLVEKKISD